MIKRVPFSFNGGVVAVCSGLGQFGFVRNARDTLEKGESEEIARLAVFHFLLWQLSRFSPARNTIIALIYRLGFLEKCSHIKKLFNIFLDECPIWIDSSHISSSKARRKAFILTETSSLSSGAISAAASIMPSSLSRAKCQCHAVDRHMAKTTCSFFPVYN